MQILQPSVCWKHAHHLKCLTVQLGERKILHRKRKPCKGLVWCQRFDTQPRRTAISEMEMEEVGLFPVPVKCFSDSKWIIANYCHEEHREAQLSLPVFREKLTALIQMTNGSFPQYFRKIIVPSGKPCHSCNRVSRPRMCSNSFCAEFISVNRFILEFVYLFICLEHPGTWSIGTGLPGYAANELFLGAFIRDIIPEVYQWLFTRSLSGNYKLKFISARPVPLPCSPVLSPLSIRKKKKA